MIKDDQIKDGYDQVKDGDDGRDDWEHWIIL